MMMLKKQGELNVGELVESSGLSQPSVSKHLATLRTAGLVSMRREGTTIFYALRSREIAALCDIMCATLQEEHARLGAALKSVGGTNGRQSKRGGISR
jgi:ArsR family transcriptional regulator